ncbi:MAG TPA: hypothetical protein VNX26_00760 [Candidatus Acidoferrum sp.]|jgi:hypothetical protein|nr:hypothetical protein [Candidatus Acidoferrum sp.]
MAVRRKFIFVLGAVTALFAGAAVAQESPSLGDLARQQRQQSKPPKGKDAKASKVITNEEIPEHGMSAPAPTGQEYGSSMPASSSGAKEPAEHWKSQIQAQKSQIASVQKQIDQVNESIRFAPANCVGRRCVEWNERQREKQQQVERMQAQLDEQKKRMEEMQEAARKQGYGNSVYDP